MRPALAALQRQQQQRALKLKSQQEIQDRLAEQDRLDPAQTNWRIAHFGDIDPETGGHMGRNPNESQWGQYGRVMNFRGAQFADADPTPDTFDTETLGELSALKRSPNTQLPPSRHARLGRIFRGLEQAGKKLQDYI